MKFQINQRICIAHDLCDPNSIKEYTITKILNGSNPAVQCGSSEMTFYQVFCWPIEAKNQLTAICELRQEYKKQLDDSMMLIYKLRNELSAKG